MMIRFIYEQMLSEYLKLSRFFNMGLTAVAPVLGALSMWGNSEIPPINLLILFIIGCFSHIYGFVLNDIIDIKIDKLSKELKARPLVGKTITRKKAAYFAISCMIVALLLSAFFFKDMMSYIVLLSLLIFAYILATIYDIASKKYPGMDVFVVSAIFFLILFGAASASIEKLLSTPLAWIIALIGSIQVLFMNMINGAIKDINHDAKGLANTLAIRLGAMTKGGRLTLPTSFKAIGYLVEIVRSVLIFLPFILLSLAYELWQIAVLLILTMLTFFSIYKLFSIKTFKRNQVRRLIGIIVIFMYATTPVMLYSLNPYIIFVALIPPLWFIFGNIILHKTVLEPKTM